MNHIYGYARVSTKEQCADRQLIALQQYGIDCHSIFLDQISGKDFNRPAYQRLLRRLRPGDTLVIKSIDRLGRNYEEILAQWRLLSKEKDIIIVVLDMPILNTGQDRDLTRTLISDIVLQLLSYVAQTEREFIRSRQAEGIAAAKARGVTFGPRPMPRPREYAACFQLWTQSEISAREAARRLGVSHKTFLKWGREDTKIQNLGQIVEKENHLANL